MKSEESWVFSGDFGVRVRARFEQRNKKEEDKVGGFCFGAEG